MDRDASAAQIRAAYRRLARQHHPDLNPESDPSRFHALDEAYRSLIGGRPPAEAADPPRPTVDEPAVPPEPVAPGQADPPGQADEPPTASSPLAVASILVPLAAVVCAPGPLLFCGILLAPVGAVLGHLARWQARRHGQPAPGLAGVGIAVGWSVSAVLLVTVTVGVLVSRGA